MHDKLYSDSAVPTDSRPSISTIYNARQSTAGLSPSDVTVTSRSFRGIAARRRRRSQSVMADVDNDKCNGVAGTRNEKCVGETRCNDNNNNEDDDDDDGVTGSTTTSEEAQSQRCRAVTQVRPVIFQ